MVGLPAFWEGFLDLRTSCTWDNQSFWEVEDGGGSIGNYSWALLFYSRSSFHQDVLSQSLSAFAEFGKASEWISTLGLILPQRPIIFFEKETSIEM